MIKGVRLVLLKQIVWYVTILITCIKIYVVCNVQKVLMQIIRSARLVKVQTVLNAQLILVSFAKQDMLWIKEFAFVKLFNELFQFIKIFINYLECDASCKTCNGTTATSCTSCDFAGKGLILKNTSCVSSCD